MSPVKISPEQVERDKISHWPRPITKSEMASFLGVCKFYKDLVLALTFVSDALYIEAQTRIIE